MEILSLNRESVLRYKGFSSCRKWAVLPKEVSRLLLRRSDIEDLRGPQPRWSLLTKFQVSRDIFATAEFLQIATDDPFLPWSLLSM